MFPSSDSLSNIDLFEDEYGQFQWDVHILIEGTLRASIRSDSPAGSGGDIYLVPAR